ncbi:endogenous retrovirus group PABLB member 1 Env polyprotein-like isoform X1 [Archocentrus centrarchus]|uniref:endogenous retrovirus group PABLB member 1 Env polyprotein-like isoform X1 n=1 Tax=Archocentrus centrarchus TaxID=63155 RepID=UPI0011E9FB71|nr:endogenous retrovirus group PABLB member 1 Env polyprotein-like isoform X1 [Archocentrus centrarchus]
MAPFCSLIIIFSVSTLLILGATSSLNYTQYPHEYATNEWWQLMNVTAHVNNWTNCYVCAHMPVAGHNTGLRPYNVSWEHSWCLYGLATHPGRRAKWSEANFTSILNVKGISSPINRNCSMLTDLLTWPQLANPLPEVLMLTHLPEKAFPACVIANGTIKVGRLPATLCNATYSYCPPTDERQCLTCLKNIACYNNLTVRRKECQSDLAYRIQMDTGELSQCSRVAPGPKGTRVLADWYFICGHKAYVSLPPDWGGLCSVAYVSDHVFFMQYQASHTHHKTKRQVGEWLTSHSEVPEELRIWGVGAKIAQSIFPGIGLGFVRDQVEINRYALLRLVNTTIALGQGTLKELSSLRAMVMQNRIVLDLLTASQGGVCKIIGKTCCTYIPDEDDAGGAIREALDRLTELQKYVQQHTQESQSDWFSWLNAGTWWQVLLKCLTPVLCVLVLICVFTMCILPCIRSMITKIFTGYVVSYLQLQMVDQDAEMPEDIL